MSRTIAALRQLAAALGEAHEREAAPKITAEQSIAGPPLYMAPEAIVAPETVGPPADVYGVGCVACFLLTGRTPFEATNLVEICAAHVLERPEPPSRHVASVPPGARRARDALPGEGACAPADAASLRG